MSGQSQSNMTGNGPSSALVLYKGKASPISIQPERRLSAVSSARRGSSNPGGFSEKLSTAAPAQGHSAGTERHTYPLSGVSCTIDSAIFTS